MPVADWVDRISAVFQARYIESAAAPNPMPQRTARKIPARGSIGAGPPPRAPVCAAHMPIAASRQRAPKPQAIRRTTRFRGSIVIAGAVR